MRWSFVLLAACGGSGETPPDAAPTSPSPTNLRDDEQPYELLASCADVPVWPDIQSPMRVAAVSSREAYIAASSNLFHLLPDGTVETEPLQGVFDVRRCDGVTWAVGADALVARKFDGGAWESMMLPAQPPFTEVHDAGVGCGDDVWIGFGLAVHVFDGLSWRSIPTAPTFFDPEDPGAGSIVHDAVYARGAGTFRVAASAFGETLAYFPERNEFVPVAGTDDAISDAIVFRDGTGATLYNGHALAFDRDEENDDGDSPLDGFRATRRSDKDIWIVRNELVHFDGSELTVETVPIVEGGPGFFEQDLDARFDAVWAVGFDGAAVKTTAGWCRVVTSARI